MSNARWIGLVLVALAAVGCARVRHSDEHPEVLDTWPGPGVDESRRPSGAGTAIAPPSVAGSGGATAAPTRPTPALTTPPPMPVPHPPAPIPVPGLPGCPSTPPEHGSACYTTQVCTYLFNGYCGSPPDRVLSCIDGIWLTVTHPFMDCFLEDAGVP